MVNIFFVDLPSYIPIRGPKRINNRNNMRTFLLSIALLISAVAAAQVPSVTVENSKGESFDTSLLVNEGTPMILSFWSTSCKPCIRELDAIYDAMPD